MAVVIQTDDELSAADRFAQYRQQVIACQPVPVEVQIDRTDGFAAQIRTRDVGMLTMSTLSTRSCVPYVADRTPALIRRGDPEAYRLVVNLRGDSRTAHGEHEVELGPGDMALYDTSVPFRVWRGARGAASGGEPGTDTWVMMTFPHALLPLPPRSVRLLLGGRLAGRTGIGALISGLVTRVASDQEPGWNGSAFHLSNAVVDLLTALLADEVDETAVMPAESAQRALLLRLQGFIEHRLGDPELDPETVAAAHHISTRSLHRLFSEHGLTVSGWIRARRLDRCQRDLVNPAQAAEPIHVIAARWGFRSQAHFSRLFRTVYGMSPADYRRQDPAAGSIKLTVRPTMARRSGRIAVLLRTWTATRPGPGSRRATPKINPLVVDLYAASRNVLLLGDVHVEAGAGPVVVRRSAAGNGAF